MIEVVRGIPVGVGEVTGIVQILKSPEEELIPGRILLTDCITPDWVSTMSESKGIITNRGGRTSHAAIHAREMGILAVVGTGDATEKIKDGEKVTIKCTPSEGYVYVLQDKSL